MISTLFGWFWLTANLTVLWFALTRKLNYLVRTFIVVGAMLGAAAGFCNGLVMIVNDWRMPVDSFGVDWDAAPRFLDGPEHRGRFYCRAYRAIDPPDEPWRLYGGMHDHPPEVETSKNDAPTPPTKPFRPKLAALDDRHPVVACGEYTLYSKGDVFGALGAMLMVPGLTMLLLGRLWRKLRRN